MRIQAHLEHTGVYQPALTPSVGRAIETAVRFARTRLLEVTVGVLLAVWSFQLFGLWIEFTRWATSLEVPF